MNSKTIPLLILLVLLLAAPVAAEVYEETTEVGKVRVKEVYKIIDLNTYMYNETSKTLLSVDTSLVEIKEYEMKDLALDDVYPSFLLNLSSPTVDVNTGEKIVYGYVLRNVLSDSITLALIDLNETDNTVLNITVFKITPAYGDISIVTTGYDIVFYYSGLKYSIPLSGFNNPKVMVFTDEHIVLSGIVEVELRALTNPPEGFILVRDGTGQATFIIHASGRLSVWFDETHSGGDVDLFIFDVSNPFYSECSESTTWDILRQRCDQFIYADYYPQIKIVEATGQLKFIVKRYSGNPDNVQWRVAVSHEVVTTTTETPTATQTPTATTPATIPAVLSRITGVLSNPVIPVLALLGLIILVLLLRR